MSNPTGTIPAVTASVTVAASVEQAFKVFTASFATWWPASHHIGEAEMAEAIIEPRVGGRWYERGVDGSECDWGRVIVWEPPHRLVLTWQITGEWRYDPDPAHASELEITFTAEDAGHTRVELEHRHLERLVGGDSIRQAVSGPNGWSALLATYARAVADAG